MWRERVALVAVACVVAAACTSDEVSDLTSTSQSAAGTTTTQTTAPPVTTTAPADSTTTTSGTDIGSEAVGSAVVLAEQIDIALGFASLFYEDADLSEVPVPDLTNPDPRVAAGAIYEFETWLTTVAPVRDWAEVLAQPGTVGYTRLLRGISALDSNLLVAVFEGEYSVDAVEFASEEDIAASAPQEVVDEIPENAALLVVTTSASPFDFVDPAGEVLDENEGWRGRRIPTVLVPTDAGWKLFWRDT